MKKHKFYFEVVSFWSGQRVNKPLNIIDRNGVAVVYDINSSKAMFQAVQRFAWVSKNGNNQWMVHPIVDTNLDAPVGDEQDEIFADYLNNYPNQRKALKKYLEKRGASHG